VDIFEVMQVLGVEAARRTIINEITKTIKSHSLNVDRRHLILVADVLTSKGTKTINQSKYYYLEKFKKIQLKSFVYLLTQHRSFIWFNSSGHQ